MLPPPVHVGPVLGETGSERNRRVSRNALARAAWHAYLDDRCDACRHARGHVSHELDPEHSPEGPEYHADFAHHPFVETPLSRQHASDYGVRSEASSMSSQAAEDA